MSNVLLSGANETSGVTLVRDIKSHGHTMREPICIGAGNTSALVFHTALMHMSNGVLMAHITSCARACRATHTNSIDVEAECCASNPFNINRMKQPLTIRKGGSNEHCGNRTTFQHH